MQIAGETERNVPCLSQQPDQRGRGHLKNSRRAIEAGTEQVKGAWVEAILYRDL